MGIGWTVAHRATIINGDILAGKGDDKSKADSLVVDGPAAFRRLMFTPQTPTRIAQQFVKHVCSRSPGKTLDGVIVSVIFDDSKKMPPQRALVAASRARANPPDPDGPRLDPHRLSPGHLHETMNWEALLPHSDSKKAIWELVGRAVFEQLCAHDGCIVEVITAGASYLRDTSKLIPVRRPTCHGEADLLVSARASELSACGRNVEIITVDYDQVLQSLLAPIESSIAHAIRFKTELIDAKALIETYGGNCRSRRLSAAFFMLCAFKSDYSKSLCKPTKSRVSDFVSAMKDGVIAIYEKTDEKTKQRTLYFKPPALLGVVKSWPFGKEEIEATSMLENILWTLAYFAEYDAYKPERGGPSEIKFDNFIEKSVTWTLLSEISFLTEKFGYKLTTTSP